jgi:hypothetical protein
LLGVIPGVGAMYNEQYAKGIFHLLVFAVLISLSHSSDLFGFFAFGWICYMVIEAHHTARARRDGTPLPNPFGLNDLSERLGFGRAWPGTTATGAGPAATPGGTTASGYPPAQNAPGPFPAEGGASVPPASQWGAPADAFPAAPFPAAPHTGFPGAAYNPGYAAGFPPPYATGYAPPVQPFPPYGVPLNQGGPFSPPDVPFLPPAPGMPGSIAPPSRFPAGAVWLIGLGVIFLLSTTGIFHMVFGWSLVGFVLIGLAVWVFLRRMLDSGASVANDHTAGYPLRVVRALGPSVWLFLIGVLLLLDAFQIVPWHRSWPLFIILAGVMALLQRAAWNSAAAASFATTQYPAASPTGDSTGNPAKSAVSVRQGNDSGSDEPAHDANPHQGGN